MARALRWAAERLLSFFLSIRFRLTLWFVFILGIVLAVFSTFIYFVQARDLQADEVGHMQDKFARVMTYFRSAEWQNSNLSPANVPGSSGPLQPGDLLMLADASGQVLQNWGASISNPGRLISGLISASSQRHGLNVYEQAASVVSDTGQHVDSDYLFIITPVVRADQVVGFLIIGSPSGLNSQLHRLALSLLAGSLGMLAFAFLGGLWLADRAMRPVKAITQTAQSIGEIDLSRRINLRGRDELAQLAGTFDNMLTRLQAAFERQRRFVADASHELRTPLTIMNLEVGRALSAQRSAAEYQHALQVVNAESERMTRLVKDLMALARMDAGQAILQFEDVDLSDISLEAVERMSALATRQQVKLETGDLPELRVRGDEQYLIQMVSNLLENAIKYSGAGRTVRIETGANRAGSERSAWLRVSDTGPGIPSEHLPHLFDRFYRVDAARTPEADSPGGSGLGLSIVAWIVNAHGGTISVRSELGRGSAFEVTLPLENST